MSDGPNVWAIVIPAASGLTGALGGAFFASWLTRRNERRKQRLEFASQQLRELYSPLVGIRAHIRSLSVLREKVFNHADLAWQTLVEEARERGGPTEIQKLRAERWAEYETIITDSNDHFRKVVMPLYEQMLTTFRDKYWLAEPSTQKHFAALLEFIELWNRHLARTIPPEVITLLNVRERELDPLYKDLDDQFALRQEMLRSADPDAHAKTAP